jgi:WD40 repeat protein
MGECSARVRNFVVCMALISVDRLAIAGDSPLAPPTALRAGWAGPPVPAPVEKRLGAEWFKQGAPVLALAVSPDGRTLAVAAENGEVCLRDVDTGAFTRRLDVSNKVCLALTFSPDGLTIALGFQEPRVGVWDVPTGKPVWQNRTKDEFGPVGLAFSPDGNLLAAGASDGNVRIWDRTGREKLHLDYGADGGLRTLSFSADGRNIAGAGLFSGLKQWDATNGHELAMGFPGRMNRGRSVYTAAYSPDGQFLATGGDGQVWIWDLIINRPGLRFGDRGWGGGGAAIDWLAFLPSGRTLVSTGIDNRVRLWDLDKGEPDGEFGLVDPLERERMRAIALSKEGWLVTASGKKGTVRVYDLAAGAPGADNSKIEVLWSDLGTDDVLRAQRAVVALAARPAEAVRLLRRRLSPAPEADTSDVRKLVASLDGDRFAERETAEIGLRRLGERAAPELVKLLEASPSAEARERATRILDGVRSRKTPPVHAESRISERALMVLARIGTPEAREFLEDLSDGAPDSPQTLSAKAILDHLEDQK